MWKPLRAAVPLVLGASGLALGSDLFLGRPLRRLCYLPNHPYQRARTTNPVSTVSLTAVAAPNVAPLPEQGAAGPVSKTLRVKQFQMNAAEVRVDHCALTRVSVVLVEDGTWIVAATAEQNPNSVDAKEQPRFVELKRNRFHVVVRGVGLSTQAESPQTAVLGKPEYCRLAPTPFWVERGEKQSLRWPGRDADVQRYFDLIDRVEVDLSYE